MPRSGGQVAATVPASPPWLTGPLWFREVRAVELTGEAPIDSLFLVAHGAHSDSIRIAFGAVVGADTFQFAGWDSRYQLSTVRDDSVTAEESRLRILRAQLADVVQLAFAQPFDGAQWLGPWSTEDEEPFCSARAQSCVAASIRAAVSPTARGANAAFDTARAAQVLAELRSPGRVSVTYQYGTESSHELVWSPLLGRFVTVFACC